MSDYINGLFTDFKAEMVFAIIALILPTTFLILFITLFPGWLFMHDGFV